MSGKHVAAIVIVSALAGVAAALAGMLIVALTGSEPVSPAAGAIMGAALGVSAGAVIGRNARNLGSRTAFAVLEAVVGGISAALTIWLTQRR